MAIYSAFNNFFINNSFLNTININLFNVSPSLTLTFLAVDPPTFVLADRPVHSNQLWRWIVDPTAAVSINRCDAVWWANRLQYHIVSVCLAKFSDFVLGSPAGSGCNSYVSWSALAFCRLVSGDPGGNTSLKLISWLEMAFYVAHFAVVPAVVAFGNSFDPNEPIFMKCWHLQWRSTLTWSTASRLATSATVA